MSKKNKRKRRKKPQPPERPLPLKWEFEPGIPTNDFFAGRRSEDAWIEPLEDFIYTMDDDRFLAWEAVMAHEQGLRLTRRQREELYQLISFDDDEDEEDDRVLYINEIPRPSEPWYVILNKLVPHLLIEPFRTFDTHYEEKCEGWGRIVQCLEEHGDGLSLPEGAASPLEVVPAELRHKLWLQDCFDALSGLGQEEELTLEDEEQLEFRIDDFVRSLRTHQDSVRYFDLTLDSLLARVIVPERDRPILVRAIQEKLAMRSTSDRLADYL